MILKNLLFVTWDSDKTNYLESLFFPILDGLQNTGEFRCFILQFSWASKGEVNRIAALADNKSLNYSHFLISRSPSPSLGVLVTLIRGASVIKDFVLNNQIDIVMPRSTMPALMVNQIWSFLKKNNLKLVFDADGLPIEERVDFAGMKKGGLPFRFLKWIEKKIMQNADRILTRSKKAITFHLQYNPKLVISKFFVVGNGRDSQVFNFQKESRAIIRAKLGVAQDEWLWVYTGSLGPAYAWEELCGLLSQIRLKFQKGKLLVLCRDDTFAKDRTPKELIPFIQFLNIPFSAIPSHLSAGDLGISLRRPAPSLIGLSPIKLGEYFLCGLPVLASTQPGDSEELLESCEFVFPTVDPQNIDDSVLMNWWDSKRPFDREEIRAFGLNHFSLEKSIESYRLALKF